MKKSHTLKDSAEIALMFILIVLMSLPVLIVALLLVPVRYCFDERLRKFEKDMFNS